jgi:general L-amino acid transport system permease protein
MYASDRRSDIGTLKPPVMRQGILKWVRSNLFNGFFNSVLTIVILVLLWKIVPPLVRWAFIDSTWTAEGGQCRGLGGACWSVITRNLRFILFGFYPYGLQWRPLLAIIILFTLLFFSRKRSLWKRPLAYAWFAGISTMGLLLKGGLFGLEPVESTMWSGLPLTLLLSVFGLTAAYPLGVLLALGRQSQMPALKSLSIVYIETIRGVPLISLLFMSSVMFPLFLPQGITINNILRAQVAIIMFTAAYIAEVVRGGLQAIGRGQYEAAESLGQKYNQQMRLIILPQALKIVIPPSVGILISAFKDTSLVVIIGLFDVMKTTQVTLSDPTWMGYSVEAYMFIAVIYFTGCFSMSHYSRRLEKELHTGY